MLGPQDESVRVDLKDPLRHRVVLVEKWTGGDDAGVFDQGIDRAQPFLRRGQESAERAGVGDVEASTERRPAVPGRGRQDRFIDVADRDAGAAGCQRFRNNASDAPSRPGDDDDPTSEWVRLHRGLAPAQARRLLNAASAMAIATVAEMTGRIHFAAIHTKP